MTVPAPRRPAPPLDAPALERLALRYVERFATTRAKLTRYLQGKVRMRGWTGDRPADPELLAQRLADLGYVDDRMFAEAKAGAMGRRGLGARRVRDALRHAGVAEHDTPELGGEALSAAIAFARRRRIGPFGDATADPGQRERQVGQLVRAGHGFALARALASLPPGADPAVELIDFHYGTGYATDVAGEV